MKPSSDDDGAVGKLTDQLGWVTLDNVTRGDASSGSPSRESGSEQSSINTEEASDPSSSSTQDPANRDGDLRVLGWDDVCPFGDRIEKIAEASYAEIYRVTNDRGTSIIKAIRLDSPIKPQTKTQERAGLVDEEPHCEDDLRGETLISEWLADIPGFVVYKERYVVQGKAPKTLLETHQAFHRRTKRKDPDRLQFYPSPSRYLDETRFLIVELGDAGMALEDFELTTTDQLWDIFLHTAIALARAENLICFEVSAAQKVPAVKRGSRGQGLTWVPAPGPARRESMYSAGSKAKVHVLEWASHVEAQFVRYTSHNSRLWTFSG